MEDPKSESLAGEGQKSLLERVKLERVLDHSVDSKSIAVLGEIDGKPAVLKIFKKPIANDIEAARSIQHHLEACVQSHQNDIYYKYQVTCSSYGASQNDVSESDAISIQNSCESLKVEKYQGQQIANILHETINGLSCELIYPATDKIILKNTSLPMHIIEEDKQTYQQITLPWIQKNPASDLEWLTSILEGKAEQENHILKRPDWILTKDYKQDSIGQKEGFHYLALFFDRSLRSIRDLNEKHVPLLEEVLKLGRETIAKEIDVKQSEIRVYFHYLPTFFLMHVHFNHVKEVSPGVVTERAHMLPTVISNIKLRSDYYQEATFSLLLRETDAVKYTKNDE